MTEQERLEQEAEERRAELREHFRNKTGRGWSDPYEDITDMIEQNIGFDDLPDWNPSHVSQISQERVQLYEKDGSGIPLLQDLADLPLPPPPPPLPGHKQSKAYALYRKRVHFKHILERVTTMAEPKIGAIQALDDWEDKQEAVDVLFEELEAKLKKEETILGKHPHFGIWVERALEEYLKSVQNKTKKEDGAQETEKVVDDASAVPIFMDCYDAAVDSEDVYQPRILHPLKPKPEIKGVSKGRMIEEWELTAQKKSKRIMLRQSTRKIARALMEAEESKTAARIFLHGKEGIGKTAAMLSIVASARKSGSIVVFIPEGDQFHQNGFYLDPNERKKGMFDLPILTQGVCADLLKMHKEDLVSFQADSATMEKHFTEEQLEAVKGYEAGGNIAVNDLLAVAADKLEFASMCYSVVIDVLMNQDEKHFILAFDEYNCYHAPGHYFHAAYDDFYKNPKSIPYDQFSLFKPAMDAIAIYCADPDEEIKPREAVLMKRGAVIVATTESKAIARKVTDRLTACAKHDKDVIVIEVPRLSALETEHMLANFECTGLGKLRIDQGAVVMNDQEVKYLRMLSGAEPERLMNAVMVEY